MRRIAYVGMDLLASAFVYLSSRRDVTLALLATGRDGHPADGIKRHARLLKVPVLEDPGDDALVAAVEAADADLIVVAAYHRRLPATRLTAGGRTAVNLHPSLLPEGRGPTPILQLAVDPSLRAAAGLTLHLLSDAFDAGPILLAETIEIADGDGYDAIDAKMFARAPEVLGAYLDDPEAHPPRTQEGGSWWPKPPQSAWTLRAADADIAEAEGLRRRFGAFGVRVELAGSGHFFGRIVAAARTPHMFPAGGLVLFDGKVATVALRDGLARIALF